MIKAGCNIPLNQSVCITLKNKDSDAWNPDYAVGGTRDGDYRKTSPTSPAKRQDIVPNRSAHQLSIIPIAREIFRGLAFPLIKKPYSNNGFWVYFGITDTYKHQTNDNKTGKDNFPGCAMSIGRSLSTSPLLLNRACDFHRTRLGRDDNCFIYKIGNLYVSVVSDP